MVSGSVMFRPTSSASGLSNRTASSSFIYFDQERFGVAEYWVVDPELDAITIYRRVGGAFERTAELTVEQARTLSTPLLPEFSVTLARIFAAAP